MRRRIELELGSLPSAPPNLPAVGAPGDHDCITEVGGRDPLLGGFVIAIFVINARLQELERELELAQQRCARSVFTRKPEASC